MKNSDLKVGGLYSVTDGDDGFRVIKILALDEKAVHVRLYKNRFPSRPQSVNQSELSLGRVDDAGGFGMGHIPMSRENFTNGQPIFIQQSTVTEEELEGYQLWKEAGGGVW